MTEFQISAELALKGRALTTDPINHIVRFTELIKALNFKMVLLNNLPFENDITRDVFHVMLRKYYNGGMCDS